MIPYHLTQSVPIRMEMFRELYDLQLEAEGKPSGDSILEGMEAVLSTFDLLKFYNLYRQGRMDALSFRKGGEKG